MTATLYKSALTNGLIFMGLRDVFQLGATIWLARLITPEEFGTAVYAQAIVIFVAILGGNNIIMSASQFRDPACVDWLYIRDSATRLNCVLSFILIAIAALHLTFSSEIEISVILVIAALAIIAETDASIMLKIFEVNHDFQRFRLLAFMGTVTGAFFGIAIALLGEPVFALVAQSVGFVLPSVVAYRLYDKQFFDQVKKSDEMISVRQFYINKVFQNGAEKLAAVSESILVKSYLGLSDLGQISRQRGFVNLGTDKPTNLILSSILPIVTRNEKRSKDMRSATTMLFYFTNIGVLASYFWFRVFGDAVFSLIYGGNWTNYDYVVPLLMLGLVFCYVKYFSFVLQVNDELTSQTRIVSGIYFLNIVILCLGLSILEFELIQVFHLQFLASLSWLLFCGKIFSGCGMNMRHVWISFAMLSAIYQFEVGFV